MCPIMWSLSSKNGLPRRQSGKESACQCKRHRRRGFSPWFWKIPWRRTWQLTPVFLPGKLHGQRSLVGYSAWNCKESDTTEWLHFFFFYFILLYNTVLVLPYINMNPPRVYMCFQSWTPSLTSLPIPSLWVTPVHQPKASCILHQT